MHTHAVPPVSTPTKGTPVPYSAVLMQPHAAPPDERPVLANRNQLAAALGVSGRTVAAWDLGGKIPAIRIGRTVRYSIEDVIAWLRKTGGAR